MIVDIKIEGTNAKYISKDGSFINFKKTTKKKEVYGISCFYLLIKTSSSNNIDERKFVRDIRDNNISSNGKTKIHDFTAKHIKEYTVNYDYIILLDELDLLKDTSNVISHEGFEEIANSYQIEKLKLKLIPPDSRNKLVDYQEGVCIPKNDLNHLSKIISFSEEEKISYLRGKRILLFSFKKDKKFDNVFKNLSNLFLDFDCFIFMG